MEKKLTLSKEEFWDALTLRCELEQDGTFWYNSDGEFHRVGGPAMEWADGAKFWYLNGKQHREDGPAFIGANGHKQWFVNGEKVDPF